MSRLAVKINSELRRKPIVVMIVFFAWLVLLITSMRLGVEDYTTSRLGYEAWPTRKSDESIALFVGFLPMAIQVAFGFWALERNSRIATIITIVALVVDCATDVYYKAYPFSVLVMFSAIVETLLLYTLGVEFLFLTSAENLIEYLPDVIAAVIVVFARLGQAFSKAADWLAGNDDKSQSDYRGKKNNSGSYRGSGG